MHAVFGEFGESCAKDAADEELCAREVGLED